MANLVRLVERAREFEARGGDLRAFANWLRRAAAPGGEAQAAEAQVADERDDVVRVMTVHQAKGLEFPVVFVPACGGLERSDHAAHRLRRRRGARPQAARRARAGAGALDGVAAGRATRASAAGAPSRCVSSTSQRRARAIWWSSRASRCARISVCWRQHLDAIVADETHASLLRVVDGDALPPPAAAEPLAAALVAGSTALPPPSAAAPGAAPAAAPGAAPAAAIATALPAPTSVGARTAATVAAIGAALPAPASVDAHAAAPVALASPAGSPVALEPRAAAPIALASPAAAPVALEPPAAAPIAFASPAAAPVGGAGTPAATAAALLHAIVSRPAPRPGNVTVAVTQLADFQLCPRRYQQFHALGLQEHPSSSRAASPDVMVDVDDLLPPLDPLRRGTLAHRLLERAAFRRDGADPAALDRLLAADGYEAKDPLVAEVRGHVAAFLGTPFARGLAGVALRRELPFLLSVPYDGGALYLRGQMDLVVLTADGVIVVDYKHSRTGDPEDYRFQLDAYALAARRLYPAAPSVRTGLAFLKEPDPSPQIAPAPPSAPFEAKLAELGRALSAARAADDWAQRPLATCHRLRCGFIYRCYPTER